jgi:pimeloyl-ACP methyl ester carboxylesterase
MGDGPLVIFLHGFPLFWWTWRHQLQALADAGYRAVAVDMRGYGGSDHTPHGYDPLTLAADTAGLIRSLGAREAVVVGQGWGAIVAWTIAATEPDLIRGIGVVGMPHPALLRNAFVSDAEQRRRASYIWGLQRPFIPEKQLVRNDAAAVGEYLRTWSGSSWPDPATESVFRAAMLIPNTAHCSVEFHRWAVRSIPRSDGRRFQATVADPVKAPVLHIHGVRDGAILPRSIDGSEHYAETAYQRNDLDEVGHFPHEEDPERFNTILLRWLEQLQT